MPSPAVAAPFRVAFTPTRGEHLRATTALRRVARVFDPLAALPYFLACQVLFSGILNVGAREGPLGYEEFFSLVGPFLFFVGVELRTRRGLGKPLAFGFGADGIEVAQARHRWSVAWSRVGRVEETAEFFLVDAGHAAFYIPRRALDDAGEAEVRERLAARGTTTGDGPASAPDPVEPPVEGT